MLSSKTSAIIGFLVASVAAVDKTRSPGLISQLITSATNLDRLNLLPANSDWLFDFSAQSPFYNFAPGGVTNMNAATFPAAAGQGLTMAMLNLGPCAMLPPHFHPRASNFVVAISGNTTTYMFGENGAHTITEILTPMKATIFPQGSVHMMVNNGCENSQLVSALSSSDAGTSNLGNIFTNGFPSDWVNAAFGSSVVNSESAPKMDPVGTGSNYGTAECLQRCKISPSTSS